MKPTLLHHRPPGRPRIRSKSYWRNYYKLKQQQWRKANPHKAKTNNLRSKLNAKLKPITSSPPPPSSP